MSPFDELASTEAFHVSPFDELASTDAFHVSPLDELASTDAFRVSSFDELASTDAFHVSSFDELASSDAFLVVRGQSPVIPASSTIPKLRPPSSSAGVSDRRYTTIPFCCSGVEMSDHV